MLGVLIRPGYRFLPITQGTSLSADSFRTLDESVASFLLLQSLDKHARLENRRVPLLSVGDQTERQRREAARGQQRWVLFLGNPTVLCLWPIVGFQRGKRQSHRQQSIFSSVSLPRAVNSCRKSVCLFSQFRLAPPTPHFS